MNNVKLLWTWSTTAAATTPTAISSTTHCRVSSNCLKVWMHRALQLAGQKNSQSFRSLSAWSNELLMASATV